MQSASRAHWFDGRSTHAPSWHACPAGQEPAAQAGRHCWFTHTRPAPHCELKRHESVAAWQRPPTQVLPAPHCASSASIVHAQVVVATLQVGRAQTPSTQVAPPWQSSFVRHAPGFGVGVGSRGATQ